MDKYKPETKIAYAGAIGTPLALVLVWLTAQFGLDMPAEVGGAFGALVAAAVGYFKKSA